jgi:hypothetical protein
MVIRTEQIQVFRLNMLDRFVDRLLPLLSKQWPERTAQLGADFRPLVDSRVNRAISYGIDTEASLARFVNLCFVWGPDFETRPEHAWAMKILKDSKLRGTLKVNELAFRTRIKLDQIKLEQQPATRTPQP